MSTRRVAAWAMLPALFAFVSCSRQKILDDATLRNADQDTGNWVMYGRTYDDHRFSPLNQINEQTVSKLGLVWSRELGTTRGLEATPLVKDGAIYTTGSWSMVYSIDAKTGEVRWTYDPKVPREQAYFICCDVVNRGVALYRGKVYVGTLDGRLIALDEKSGTPVWTASTTDSAKQYSITGAPRIAKGLVIIGNAGAENGVRGYISAYDAETGKMAWRTYTVPGDPSKGFESKALESAAKPGRANTGRQAGAAQPGKALSTTRHLTCCTSERATPRLGIGQSAGEAIVFTRPPSLRYTRAMANWPGISKPRPGKTGTTMLHSR
jgi:quinohemoprotein ethanol dehydrogenase